MEDLDRLVRLVKKNPASFETLCDRLNLPPRKVRALVRRARREGYAVDVAGEDVALRPASPSTDIVDVRCAPQAPGKPHQFFIASDLHFGSKYHLRPELVDFIDRAYDKGCRIGLLPGDITDGCYRHGRWELTHHGFQEQAADFLEGLPRRRGLLYFGITGNHDETFEKDSGLVVHDAFNDMARARGRDDITFLGARGAYVRLRAPGERRGCIAELWHPLKGPAYALSYKLQKKVEGYAPGQKPDMLFAGHWHQAVYFISRGVHAFSCGTFQGGGSSFGKALGGAPTIGGWTVKYAVTKDGTLRDVETKFTSYYENESPREVDI